MGRNLWQLLVAPPALTRGLSGRDVPPRTTTTTRESRDAAAKNATLRRTSSLPKLGHYSHGSGHSFLGSAEGTEYMKTWKMPSPLKIADKLKSSLLNEMTSAEWELVEENEWDDGTAAGTGRVDDPSAVTLTEGQPAMAANGDTLGPATKDNNANAEQGAANRSKGTSGWTKVKSR
jgi:hypothetical protein